MNRQEAHVDIAAYLARRLPEAETSQVEAHLSLCDECEELVSSLRPLGDAIARHGDALFEPHPDSGDLVRLARGETVGDTARLQRHLLVCAACRLEMESLPSTPAISSDAAPFWVRAGKPASLLAAGLVAGVLLTGLIESWQPSWNGPIDLPVLQRVTRSGGALTRILVQPRQTALVIAVPFEAPKGRPGTETLQLQVLAADGAVVYTLREPAERLGRHADASGVIPLMLQSRGLPPGRYRVVLTGAGGAADLIAVDHFEIVSGAGSTEPPED